MLGGSRRVIISSGLSLRFSFGGSTKKGQTLCFRPTTNSRNLHHRYRRSNGYICNGWHTRNRRCRWIDHKASDADELAEGLNPNMGPSLRQRNVELCTIIDCIPDQMDESTIKSHPCPTGQVTFRKVSAHTLSTAPLTGIQRFPHLP